MMKLATWNVCLGVKGKKDYIKTVVCQEDLDICCIQECDIKPDYPMSALTFKNYNIEVEKNDVKSRCCIYIRNTVNYERRSDLEGENNNLVIIEVGDIKKYIIINLYRSFSAQHGVSLMDRFTTQLDIIKTTSANNPNKQLILLGDFNLNYSLVNNSNYNYKSYFDKLNLVTQTLDLTQVVHDCTWSRVVNGSIKESILDHVYIGDATLVEGLTMINPAVGDHKLIKLNLSSTRQTPKIKIKRDWRHYSKESLLRGLHSCNFDVEINDVQQLWNNMENEIIQVVDTLIPYVEFTNNAVSSTHPSVRLKPKINKKRRLLKLFKITKNPNLQTKISALNSEILMELKNSKKACVRRSLVAGNSKSLWNAVNYARDININDIPQAMKLEGKLINNLDLSNSFAEYFDNKVKKIVESCRVDEEVYNGNCKVTCPSLNFMTLENISRAMKSIKVKNSEGFDRIPQRIFNEGLESLLHPVHRLFNLIYSKKEIPEQWSISKIVPIHKKGAKNEVENYRPIANLCSVTKIFEQLIIDRMRDIERECNVDLTGKPQHGFKQKRSTATAGLTLQSILARAMDQNKYALMSSIDLSAAFDVVNIKLLLKRLKIIGLPGDLIDLIAVWLSNRLFYVDIDGDCSFIKSTDTGTIQGSRLGPILYAIFVSPLFDIEKMSNYADDNFIVRWESDLTKLIKDMEKSLEAITKWLKKSGLKVNETKTEVCLFHRSIEAKIHLSVNGSIIESSKSMSVLGVIFDSKLNWNDHIAKAINKANSALHCIRLIKNYFTPEELTQIITSNFYSVLYYNSEIWNIPTLNFELKQRLLSVSASALKICTPSYHDRMSFAELHKINSRATPNQMCEYKHALLLHKLVNLEQPGSDWVDLNFQQNFNNRSSTFKFVKTNNYKIGLNLLCNRLTCVDGKINFDWMSSGFESYKVQCKNVFLKNDADMG